MTTPSEFGTPGPTFPLNAGYAVCWDVDVTRSLLHRRVAGLAVVLYRKADKTVAALEDACWHRLAPLSRGKLVGDEVQCPYHGLRYDSDGRCTFMPAQPTINPSAGVRAFP